MNVNTSSPSVAIRDVEIQSLVATWYQKLDVHAALEELTPLLSQEGLKMVFPETTAEGLPGFQQWYERVIHLFFDEIHQVQDLKIVPKPDRTEVQITVKWQSSRWLPPAPTSERISMNADQTWEVVRSPATGQPVILTYVVNAITYDDGSAKL